MRQQASFSGDRPGVRQWLLRLRHRAFLPPGPWWGPRCHLWYEEGSGGTQTMSPAAAACSTSAGPRGGRLCRPGCALPSGSLARRQGRRLFCKGPGREPPWARGREASASLLSSEHPETVCERAGSGAPASAARGALPGPPGADLGAQSAGKTETEGTQKSKHGDRTWPPGPGVAAHVCRPSRDHSSVRRS